MRSPIHGRHCAAKFAYDSRTKAAKALRGMRKRGPKYENRPMEPYRCTFCGKWHLGHRPSQ